MRYQSMGYQVKPPWGALICHQDMLCFVNHKEVVVGDADGKEGRTP